MCTPNKLSNTKQNVLSRDYYHIYINVCFLFTSIIQKVHMIYVLLQVYVTYLLNYLLLCIGSYCVCSLVFHLIPTPAANHVDHLWPA